VDTDTAIMMNDHTTAEALAANADLWAGEPVKVLATPANGGHLPADIRRIVVDWDGGESEGAISSWLLMRSPRPRIVIVTSPSDRERADAERRPLAGLRRDFPETVATVERPFRMNDLRNALLMRDLEAAA